MISFAPPMAPKEAFEEARAVLDRARLNQAGIEEIEDAAVSYSIAVWPYKEAFNKFFESYKELFFEKLLLQKASHAIKKAYDVFKISGGHWTELYKGGLARILAPETSAELGHLLVDIINEIRKLAVQAVSSTEREKYELEIENFKLLHSEINCVLDKLHELSLSEEREQLVGEIQQFIKSFKHDMAMIGRKVSLHALENAFEHFKGRKKDLRILV